MSKESIVEILKYKTEDDGIMELTNIKTSSVVEILFRMLKDNEKIKVLGDLRVIVNKLDNEYIVMKCQKCKTKITMWDSCGTGWSWMLTKCSNCNQLYAQAYPGGFIPKEANEDKEIIILKPMIELIENTDGSLKQALGYADMKISKECYEDTAKK
jgi:phage FluMu protein Com